MILIFNEGKHFNEGKSDKLVLPRTIKSFSLDLSRYVVFTFYKKRDQFSIFIRKRNIF